MFFGGGGDGMLPEGKCRSSFFTTSRSAAAPAGAHGVPFISRVP